jgi:CRP/FNR family transcriptional regulator, cyclic AMP receptor protein
MHRKLVGSDGPERLGGIEFFGGLSEAHRRMLARHIDQLDADPGDHLMDEGDYGYEAIFIEDGTAEVRQQGELINTIGPGEIVGELALVESDGRRTATVTASTPLRALSLTSRSFHEIRSRMPDLGEAIDRAAREHHERDQRRAEQAAGT